MNKEELLKNVKLACDENIPKGIELAWGDLNGNSVKWEDLRSALETCCGDICRANGMLPKVEAEEVPSDV